jgi:hypothetical protein
MTKIYPCKDCILIGICSKPCSGISYNVSLFMLRTKVCIDCGHTEYYENIHQDLYYMVCVNCLSTYFIGGDSKQVEYIFRSQLNKSTHKHLNEDSDTGGFNPKRSFSECVNRWHRLRENLK